MSQFKVLIVDDEPDIIDFLRYNLEKENYIVESANDGIEAIEKAKLFLPDIVLLDVMMPNMDGNEACSILRQDKRFNETLIAFLTARGEDYSQVKGLESGADDYITKPIRPQVLMSRIKALLRRHPTKGKSISSVLEIAGLTIDKENVAVIRVGEEIPQLARKEFDLLFLLASKPGKVFSREEIFKKVWGENVIVGDRTIDVHIRKIREKIKGTNIKTVKGLGYKFDA